jgi:hypothetical protein
MSKNPRKQRKPESGPVCAANFVGDDLNFESSSDDDTRARVGTRVDSSSDEEVQRKPVSRSVQARSAGRSVRVHSLSGPTLMNAKAATTVASAVDSDWKEVSVSYRLVASLRELANGDVTPELKLSEKAMGIFDNSEHKRSENHICGGIAVTEYDSTFPVTLHVDVQGIKSSLANSFTHTGTRGALTIRPRGNFTSSKGIAVAAGNMEKADKSTFLRDYKNWNLNNIDGGITYCADGVNAMIEFGHPVVEFYNAVLISGGDDPIDENDLLRGTNMFMARVGDVNTCLTSLKKIMQENLQIQNLYGVSFKLSRAYGDSDTNNEIPWDDAAEVLDGVQVSKTSDAILDQKRTIYLKATFKVRTLDRQ